MAHLRLRLRRSRLAHLGVTLTLAISLASAAHHWAADIARRSEALGPSRRVLVARTALQFGAAVGPHTFVWQDRPVAFLPPDALRSPPARTRLVRGIQVNEVVTTSHLAGGLAGSDLIPPGWAGVLIPVGNGLPRVEVGDRVRVVAAQRMSDPVTATPGEQPAAGEGVTGEVGGERVRIVEITDDALVVALDTQGPTVALPAPDVTRVVGAAADGLVTLAVQPG